MMLPRQERRRAQIPRVALATVSIRHALYPRLGAVLLGVPQSRELLIDDVPNATKIRGTPIGGRQHVVHPAERLDAFSVVVPCPAHHQLNSARARVGFERG